MSAFPRHLAAGLAIGVGLDFFFYWSAITAFTTPDQVASALSILSVPLAILIPTALGLFAASYFSGRRAEFSEKAWLCTASVSGIGMIFAVNIQLLKVAGVVIGNLSIFVVSIMLAMGLIFMLFGFAKLQAV